MQEVSSKDIRSSSDQALANYFTAIQRAARFSLHLIPAYFKSGKNTWTSINPIFAQRVQVRICGA